MLALGLEFWSDVLSVETIYQAWKETMAAGHTRIYDAMRDFTDRLNSR
jgi:hypothetical protein